MGSPERASLDGGKAATHGGEDAVLVRGIARAAFKATLATVDRDSGHPYASLVAIATAAGGQPLLLVSGLAEHTRNLGADARASLLIDGSGRGPRALTGARVTLVGRVEPEQDVGARRRYLARHPDAAQFIDFKDFVMMRLEVERAHLVAGFGRIVRLAGHDTTIETADAMPVVEGEAGILQHMNEDHSDAIAAMAGAGGATSGRWTMIGCDPEGIDLSNGEAGLRLRFPHRVTSIAQVRTALVDMTAAARNKPRQDKAS